MEPQAQNGGTPVASDANATSGTSNQGGQQSPQPAGTGNQVDTGSAEGANRNSGPGDGGDGGDGGDSGSGRPGRAQRTINDLTSRYREAQRQLQERDSFIDQIMKDVDTSKVKLPGYTPGEEITQERINQDVVSAARQITAMTIAPALKDMADKIIQRDGAKTALREFREAVVKYPKLNEADSDNYDPALSDRINRSYERFFKLDPDYTFEEHLDLFKDDLGKSAKTSSSQEERGATRGSGRGTSINRGSGQGSRRSAPSLEALLDKGDFSAAEALIHAQNAE